MISVQDRSDRKIRHGRNTQILLQRSALADTFGTLCPLISYPVTHDKQRRVTALFYSCLVRLLVDIVGLVLGVDDLLALVETKVARQHIAERDGEKEIRHTVISKQLKADEQ